MVAHRRDELAVRRELRAWRRAVAHLNARGLAAAVPPEAVEPLRRYGLAVWAAGNRRAS